MTIPFLNLFKKLTSRWAPDAAEQKPTSSPVRVAKKPASERLSKTVLPHATRSFAPPDLFRSAAGAPSPRATTPPLELGAGRTTAAGDFSARGATGRPDPGGVAVRKSARAIPKRSRPQRPTARSTDSPTRHADFESDDSGFAALRNQARAARDFGASRRTAGKNGHGRINRCG